MSRACSGCTAFVAAFVSVCVVVSCDVGNDDVQGTPASALVFGNAWVRPPIAGRAVTAAYFDVTNRGDAPVIITRFTSDEPKMRVEIHETTENDGIVHMRPLKSVTIPAGATVSFAPGGKHLMLFGFDGTASEVELHATLEGGETLPVAFANRPEQDR